MFIFNHRYFLFFLTGKSCLPMADNVLEPYTFSFGDANPASIGCSSRVWVLPNKYFATRNKQMYIRLHCLQAL